MGLVISSRASSANCPCDERCYFFNTDEQDSSKSDSDSGSDSGSDFSDQAYVATSLPWLLPPTAATPQLASSGDKQGLVLKVQLDSEARSSAWKRFQFSLPPLLARKYHVVNVSELTRDAEDLQYQAVAAWFVVWNEAFGLQHLHSIQNKYASKMQFSEGELNQAVNEEANIDLMTQASSVGGAPTLSDCVSSAEDFVLEACIIIQLPWCTVLLHQWLTAALAEVLVFERDFLELRHWPLPAELEPCARELLWLLARLKERLLLGFAVVTQQARSYPQVDTRHPGWILDRVVLPSLATLQFLLTGKARAVLDSIKKRAWARSEAHDDGRVFVPEEAFHLDSFCTEFCGHLFYHHSYWSDFDQHASSKYEDWLAANKLEDVVGRLGASKESSPACEGTSGTPVTKPGNAEELRLRAAIEEEEEKGGSLGGDWDPTADHSARLELMLATVKAAVIDTGLLPPTHWSQIAEMFEAEAARSIAGFGASSIPGVQQAEVHAKILQKACGMLVGTEEEPGVLACVVNLGIAIVEREQAVRLANLLGQMLKVTPVATNLDASAPLSVESMSALLQEVRELGASQDRDWLWSQFPAEWRSPVSLKKRSVKHNAHLVNVFENRIGRIVFNVAQKCFDVYEKGGDVFPHWQTVQYILPCYVALFLEKKISDKVNSDHVKLLHNVLKFYEVSYQEWHTNVSPRQTPDVVSPEIDDKTLRLQIDELYPSHVYFRRLLAFISGSYCRLQTAGGVEGFLELATLGRWPIKVKDEASDADFLLLHHNLKPWLLRSLLVMEALCASYPAPESSLRSDSLVDTYDASRIIEVLELAYLKCYEAFPKESAPADVQSAASKLRRLCNAAERDRRSLHEAMYRYTEDAKNLIYSLSWTRKQLKTLYEALKYFKKLVGPQKVFYPEHFPSNPPSLKSAAVLYLNNDFAELEKMLTVLQLEPDSPASINCATSAPREERQEAKQASVIPAKNPALTSSATSAPREEVKEAKQVPAPPAKKVLALKKCRNCPRTEWGRGGTFLTCEKCLRDKYPDVNFYCSKDCKYAWWKQEHMAEHLEFDLGLVDFSHLDLDK